ncbi:hypothetical protein MMC28_000010 [Mycoblastus sanguinarius]|nr:hypothetical protein [Mycoblastus sanguinarius]
MEDSDSYSSCANNAMHAVDPYNLDFDVHEYETPANGLYDPSFNESGDLALPSILPTSNTRIPKSIHRSEENVLEPSVAQASTPRSCLKGDLFDVDELEISHILSGIDSHQWLETPGIDFDLSFLLQPEVQSIDATPDLVSSEFIVNGDYPLFGVPSPNSTSVNSANAEEIPDLTEASTPISCLTLDYTAISQGQVSHEFNTDNQRWHATLSRSRAADRSFLYGVLTTKIYCRPSCASRRPSRRHVRFFPFPRAIEAADDACFRPCKRCNPDAQGTTNSGVLGICQSLRIIIGSAFERKSAEEGGSLKLDAIAKVAGLSTFHFHRLFKATTQVTPGDFMTACRSLALQDAVGMDRDSVSDDDFDTAAFVQGLSCWSPRAARKALGGVSPKEYAEGATSRNVEHCCVGSPFGRLGIAFSTSEDTTDVSVHAVLLGEDSESRLHCRFPAVKASTIHAGRLQQSVRQLEEDGRDRDTQLTPDLLPVLWRARVWLKITHEDILG